jgi:hypothetical protein
MKTIDRHRRHDARRAPLPLSRHAQQRLQQRAVAPDAIDVLLDYGREVRSRGASLFYLDRASRARLAHELGPEAVRKLRDRLDIIVVAGDQGRIVTVSYRIGRVRRDVATRLH